VCGAITWNSSPPARTSMSLARTSLLGGFGHGAQHHVADRMAVAVVDPLKRSMSKAISASGSL
jgi:hypothetical protein